MIEWWINKQEEASLSAAPQLLLCVFCVYQSKKVNSLQAWIDKQNCVCQYNAGMVMNSAAWLPTENQTLWGKFIVPNGWWVGDRESFYCLLAHAIVG